MAELTVNQKKFTFSENIPGNVIRTLGRGKFYEEKMLRFMEKLDPENTVVDIGANIGNHTLYLATFTRCNKVVAFEAHPKIFKDLQENINSNKAQDRVVAHNLAVGDKKGKCAIDDGREGHMGGAKVIKGKDIDMDTLDAVLGKEKISLIKIDVEGLEPKVLVGAKKILTEQSPNLFIEAQTKEAKKELDAILNPLGYKAKRVFNRTPTYFYRKELFSRDITLGDRIKNNFYQLQKNRLFRISH